MAGTMWLVGSDSLGVDPEVGSILCRVFFNSVGERLKEPATFWFFNRGVFLTLDDSPILDSLKALEEAGHRLASCGTCLDFYKVKERVAAGEVGNMPLMEELIVAAEKVVSL